MYIFVNTIDKKNFFENSGTKIDYTKLQCLSDASWKLRLAQIDSKQEVSEEEAIKILKKVKGYNKCVKDVFRNVLFGNEFTKPNMYIEVDANLRHIESLILNGSRLKRYGINLIMNGELKGNIVTLYDDLEYRYIKKIAKTYTRCSVTLIDLDNKLTEIRL